MASRWRGSASKARADGMGFEAATGQEHIRDQLRIFAWDCTVMNLGVQLRKDDRQTGNRRGFGSQDRAPERG